MQAERQLVPDETIYRCVSPRIDQHHLPSTPTNQTDQISPPRSALLVACIRGGETNCHRSDAVRLMKELTALGIKPNAITYGQYTRAIAEGAFDPSLICPLPTIPTPHTHTTTMHAPHPTPTDYARRTKAEEVHHAPSPIALLLQRSPALFLSFLDSTRRDAWRKGDRWRRGLPVFAPPDTATQHRRRRSSLFPPRPPSYPPAGTAGAGPSSTLGGSSSADEGAHRRVSSSSGSLQHQRQRQRSIDGLGVSVSVARMVRA